MKMFIADAFTTELFGGNPAGVVVLDEGQEYPDNETMRKTAAELRYSETAFVKLLRKSAIDDAFYDQFQVRYFTPADEVDLCGHATIATFHCLRSAGYAKAGTTVLNRTLAGDLNINVGEDSIMMDMATPEYIDDIKGVEAMKELYSVMGLDYDANILELKPEIISTGLPDIIMPVASREELAKIAPDFPALSELSERYKVTGVHAFTLDGGTCGGKDSGVTAYCRNFAPLFGIDEEAATGTANGALTHYLRRNRVVSEPDCLFIQGEAMDRPSAVRSLTEGETIRVGGSAVILAQGEINI